jgi:hypothetical protein
VFEVLLEWPIAGPGDVVHFLVQLANVGRGSIEGTRIEVAFPDALQVRSIDCDRCIVDHGPELLTLTVGYLFSGDQVIASVATEVKPDTWPGQAIDTVWRAMAEALPLHSAQTSLVLPWAELPATGCTMSWRGLQNRWQRSPK